MRLNHNMASLNIYNQLTKNEKLQSNAMNKVSSGLKISKAADGPYALAQSETQRMQIRGLQMAQRNVQDGVSMLQVFGDVLGSVTNMLQRIRELSVQAGGGGSSSEDKSIIQNEINQMIEGIDDAVNNADFNGVKLIKDDDVTSNSSPLFLAMAAGANTNETVKIPKFKFTTDLLGDEITGKFVKNINVTTSSGIDQGLVVIDKAISTILNARSMYGALENKFESMYNNIGETSETTERAESSVRDADVAQEMIEFSKRGILIEAGNALMVQTNRMPMEALNILQNIRR